MWYTFLDERGEVVILSSVYVIKRVCGDYLNWRSLGFTEDITEARAFKTKCKADKYISHLGSGLLSKLGNYDIVYVPNATSVAGGIIINGDVDVSKFTSKVVETDVKENFNNYVNALQSNRSKLIKDMSEIDLKQQDILHAIEFMSLDAVKRTKLMNALIDIRHKRRKIKEEFEQTEIILKSISSVKFTDQKTFKYSSSVVSDILGETTV